MPTVRGASGAAIVAVARQEPPAIAKAARASTTYAVANGRRAIAASGMPAAVKLRCARNGPMIYCR